MTTGQLGGLAFGLAFLCLTAACGGGGGGGGGAGTGPGNVPLPPPPLDLELGDPLPGLTVSELAAFERGKALFERRFKPSEGLGPFYNATSCASCHSSPVTGGSSKLYRNFYLARYGDPTVVDGQFDLPGLPSAVVPAFGPRGDHATATFSFEGGRNLIPHGTLQGQPVQVAQRNAPAIYGVGLLERVMTTAIAALADPDDNVFPDGISGRYNTSNLGVGRLGVKAQAGNIEEFTRPPLMNQMGITTDPLPASLVTGQVVDTGDPFEDADGATDPEMNAQDLLDLITYQRFLAPPQRRLFPVAAVRGHNQFHALGCVKCHVPELLADDDSMVNAWTDLLLHDMGSALADDMALGEPQTSTIDGATSHREFRTAPLWGVRHSAPYMHDGRADTLFDAIEMHGGEAQSSRNAFMALTPEEQADVITFLEHL